MLKVMIAAVVPSTVPLRPDPSLVILWPMDSTMTRTDTLDDSRVLWVPSREDIIRRCDVAGCQAEERSEGLDLTGFESDLAEIGWVTDRRGDRCPRHAGEQLPSVGDKTHSRAPTLTLRPPEEFHQKYRKSTT